MVQATNPSPLDTNNKGRCRCIRAWAQKSWVVGRNNDTDNKGPEAIEDCKTPDETTSSLGDVASRRNGLASTKCDEFGRSDEGETGSNKGSPEG